MSLSCLNTTRFRWEQVSINTNDPILMFINVIFIIVFVKY